MTLTNWITIVIALVGYLVVGVTAFINLSINNTRNYMRILALEREMKEHKENTQKEFIAYSEEISEMRKEVKADLKILEGYLINLSKK